MEAIFCDVLVVFLVGRNVTVSKRKQKTFSKTGGVFWVYPFNHRPGRFVYNVGVACAPSVVMGFRFKVCASFRRKHTMYVIP